MIEQLKTLLTRWQELGQIDRLSDSDIAGIGLTRSELKEIVKLPTDSPQRMAAMARVFGISESVITADRELYRELLEVCGHCGHRAQCARALANADDLTPHDVTFCPNAATYRELSRDT